MHLPDFINESVEYLRQKDIYDNIEAAIILGSGLGSFAKHIKNPTFVPYTSIPHFPTIAVKGHAGTLIAGIVANKNIIAFSGRFHHYEGFSFELIALPVYVACMLNAKKLIMSNAVGAVNLDYKIGDLVIIDSVLRQNLNISTRGYKPNRYNHRSTAKRVRKLTENAGIFVQHGNLLYSTGPNYETKAEIRAYRKIGADVVGMSTAPELFEASRLGVKTTAISLVTNMAAGIENKKLNHAEVKTAAEAKKADFAILVKLLIEKL